MLEGKRLVESSLVECKSCGVLILKVNAETQDGMCKVCCIKALRGHITELEAKQSESLEQYMKEKERYLALVESMTKRADFTEERIQKIAKIIDNLPMRSLTEKIQKIRGLLIEEGVGRSDGNV